MDLFPCNGPQRILLPPPRGLGPGDVPSWRVVFPRERVGISELGSFTPPGGTDDDGFYPINAAFLAAPGCKIPGCQDATVFVDDGLSRCSVFLNQAFVIAPAGQAPQDQLLDFKVRVAADNIGSTVMHASVQLTFPGPGGLGFGAQDPQAPPLPRGLLATVSGVLCTQFEFWARVRVQNFGTPMPVDVRLQFVMDRLGGQFAAYRGAACVGGGDLPPPP